MSTDLPPLVARDDGTVVVSGAALPVLYRCVLAGIARQRRDGIATSPLLHQIRTELFRAAMSPTRRNSAEHPTGATQSNSQDGDPLSVGEAAALLGLSRRQVQRLAAGNSDLGGVRVGRTWVFDRVAVAALARERKAAT